MTEFIVTPIVNVIAMTCLNEEFFKYALVDEKYRIYTSRQEADQQAFLVEWAGRCCYNSYEKGRPHEEYIRHLIESGHHSVLEHVSFTFNISGVSRTLTHELIRHRVGTAYSQQSQRYVDASNVNFVVPPLFLSKDMKLQRMAFEQSCLASLEVYKGLLEKLKDPKHLLDLKQQREAARSVLPGATETQLVFTCNVRELRHIIKLRGSEHADAEIRRLALTIHREVEGFTSLFDDLPY